VHLDAAHDTVTVGDPAAGLSASFVPQAGMVCCSLRHLGDELLAQRQGLDAYARSGKTMGIPLLYPWANRLAGFGYSAAGRRIELPSDPGLIDRDTNGLPIHGVIGGRMRWTLDRASAPDASEVKAHLRWDDDDPARFAVFPFRHTVLYNARIAANRLEIELIVEASDGDHVPVALGFHPYLTLPGTPRQSWTVSLPDRRRLSLNAQQIPVGIDRTLGSERFRLAAHSFDDAFDGVADGAVFAVAAAGRRIELELIEGFGCGQIFSPPDATFVCFEPMTAPPNALASGDHLRVLNPGERHVARFAVEALSQGEPPPAGASSEL
jgi:galactose mutarotase-like enzyme